MERLQQISYSEVNNNNNITYIHGAVPESSPYEPEIEEPTNFIEEKVRKLTWEMFHSGEQRNPAAVSRFYELLGKSFESIATNGLPNYSEDASKTGARLQRLTSLRESFYSVFPNARPKDGIEKAGYDIVADVLITKEADELLEPLSPEEQAEGRLRFKESRLLDVQTLLGEMYNVHDKTTKFTIRNGKLYFDALSKEKPFDETMAFFVALSEQNNTAESRRHFEELYTYIEIGLWAQEAKLGEQYAMASSSGIAAGTRYTNNYVDVGEKKKDLKTGEEYVEVTRFKSPLSHEAYLERFLQENPAYLKGREDIPKDAALFKALYFDKNRFFNNHQLYDAFFERHPNAMDETVFLNEIYKPCIPVIVEYIERLCNFESWEDLVNAYDAVLKKSKKEYERYQLQDKSQRVHYLDIVTLSQYDETVRAGAQVIQNFTQEEGFAVGSGCGDVSTLGSSFGVAAIIQSQSVEQLIQANSVAAFLKNTPAQEVSELSDSMGSRRVKCPACGYSGDFNIRPKDGFLEGCKNPGGCPDRAAIVCDKTTVSLAKEEPVVQSSQEPEELFPRKKVIVDFSKKQHDRVQELPIQEELYEDKAA